jgi:hypothetical protein
MADISTIHSSRHVQEHWPPSAPGARILHGQRWRSRNSVRLLGKPVQQTSPDAIQTQSKRVNVRITLHWGAFVQPLLQWKKQKYYIFWVCVCSLRYPARNARAPYCHLWPDWLYSIFPHYLINGTIFGKKFIEHKNVFWFSLQSLSETFLILRRNERDMIKNVYWSSCKIRIIIVRF